MAPSSYNSSLRYIIRVSTSTVYKSFAFVTKKNVVTAIFGLFVGFSLAFLMASLSKFDLGVPHLRVAVGQAFDFRNKSKQAEELAFENRTVANQIYKEVKILCWVFTQPDNHKKKAKHILKTWGSRCNKLIFMSSAKDDEIDAIPLPVKESRDDLWAKTKESMKYIYANHLNEYDWFLKADDDTYVIVENLRFMLYPYVPETPIYFGCKFNYRVEQGYMSGGAGYVLSREAVRRFVEEALPDKHKCYSGNNGAEDLEIGKCLEAVHVVAGDSRDSAGKGRFFPFVPEFHLRTDQIPDWYREYMFYKTDEGLGSCSDNAISFHYVAPNYMYALDYLIYRLRPYGIIQNSQTLPEKSVSAAFQIEQEIQH